MSYKAYFFDFDGTIGETGADIREAWQRSIRLFGLPQEPFDRHFRIGPTPLESLAVLYPDMPEADRNRFFEIYKSFYDDAEDYQALPYAGITGMLQNLHNTGKKVYIVTNKRYKPLRKLLYKFGHSDLIDGIFSPDIIDPVNHLKKSDSLALALRIAATSAEDSIMVGDTDIDVNVGKVNHIATCAVTWGYGTRESLINASPDHLIDFPDDLP